MLDLDYEQGLNTLKDLVQHQAPGLLSEFALLQIRLVECLDQRRYGPNPGNDATRNEILYQLIRFTNDHFHLQFIDLCRTNTSIETPVETVKDRSSVEQQESFPSVQWEGGGEISVQGTRYIIHDPVTTTRASDRSVLFVRAKAQQIDANRVVWLKQLQRHRSSATAMAWTKALEKEGQLLQLLEREEQHGFPRQCAFESTIHTTTLVHTASSGQSWLQTFGRMDSPLNAHLTHMLLQSAIALGNVLSGLHKKGFAHRALSPENILLVRGTQTSVQDTGIATRTYEPGEGPEMYRAPEQMLSNRHIAVPGSYTDVYQLGKILYHFITAHVLASSEHIVPPHTWNTSISPALDAVLLRAIASNVKQRWQTTAEFSRELRKTQAHR